MTRGGGGGGGGAVQAGRWGRAWWGGCTPSDSLRAWTTAGLARGAGTPSGRCQTLTTLPTTAPATATDRRRRPRRSVPPRTTPAARPPSCSVSWPPTAPPASAWRPSVPPPPSSRPSTPPVHPPSAKWAPLPSGASQSTQTPAPAPSSGAAPGPSSASSLARPPRDSLVTNRARASERQPWGPATSLRLPSMAWPRGLRRRRG